MRRHGALQPVGRRPARGHPRDGPHPADRVPELREAARAHLHELPPRSLPGLRAQ